MRSQVRKKIVSNRKAGEKRVGRQVQWTLIRPLTLFFTLDNVGNLPDELASNLSLSKKESASDGNDSNEERLAFSSEEGEAYFEALRGGQHGGE